MQLIYKNLLGYFCIFNKYVERLIAIARQHQDYIFLHKKNARYEKNFVTLQQTTITDNERYQVFIGHDGFDGLHDHERPKQGGAEVDEE